MCILKTTLLLSLMIFSGLQSQAEQINSDGIIVNSDGIPQKLNLYNALQACPQGTHLPTIYEQMEFVKANGAKGRVDSCQSSLGTALPYCTILSDGHIENNTIFFSFDGYRAPDSDINNNVFWTATKVAGSGIGGFGRLYAFEYWGGSGNIISEEADFHLAVRCIENQK